jgi:hypothetical protein
VHVRCVVGFVGFEVLLLADLLLTDYSLRSCRCRTIRSFQMLIPKVAVTLWFCTLTKASVIIERTVEGAFKFKPFYSFIKQKARSAMIDRGTTIGVNWDLNVQSLQYHQESLQTHFEALTRVPINYPSYYLQSFHAYDDGNLSWQAAMEVESAAQTVHSPVFAQKAGELSANGDFMLRESYHQCLRNKLVAHGPSTPIASIVDVGCSTGLSTAALHRHFPDASIQGVDLSPYMLAGEPPALSSSISLREVSKRRQFLPSQSCTPQLHSIACKPAWTLPMSGTAARSPTRTVQRKRCPLLMSVWIWSPCA